MIKSESEIWELLPGVPGVEVSTFGRVRTLDRLISSEKRTRFTKGRILKQNGNGKGYLQVNIPIDGKQITRKVHRLVAQVFISNPDNLPQVNHLDCDRTNNNVENLEWCDNSYNVQYREKFGKAQNKPVFAINLKTLEVSHFSSQGEASRALGISQGGIYFVIKGKYKQTNGFWFVNDDDKADDIINRKLNEIGEARLMINMEGGN